MPQPDRPPIIAPAPLLYLGAFLLVLGLHWNWPLPMLNHAVMEWIGRAILFLGLALNSWGVWCMLRNRTPINPYRPVKTIVSSGAFRISRNPLYVGLDLILLGLVLIFDSVWGFAVLLVLLAIMHYGVILPEERYLERKFGAEYRRYRGAVRRYL